MAKEPQDKRTFKGNLGAQCSEEPHSTDGTGTPLLLPLQGQEGQQKGSCDGAVNRGTQSKSGCVTKGRQTTIMPEIKQYPGPSAFFWVHP